MNNVPSVNSVMFPPEDDPPTEYDFNRKNQYAALGRFVEAFERMVHETRESCIELILRGGNASMNLVEIAFHHPAMTAKPLFEILRAMIAEIIKNPAASVYADRNEYTQVIKQINKEYIDLVNKRNNLLHGTWFIGYSSPDDPYSEKFRIRKFRTTGDGLEQLELPTDVTELDELTIRCVATGDWIALVCACLGGMFAIRDRFYKTDGSPRSLNEKVAS
jgi:hypothetical protein